MDRRVWALNRQGKMPIVASCQGHEAVPFGAVRALEMGRDALSPYYRGTALCRTWAFPCTRG